MNPDEWLGIVHWLSDHDVRLTADLAAKYGVRLRGFDASDVRQACGYLVAQSVPLTPEAVVRQIRSRPSKYRPILEQRHRELFPNGCPNRHCDVCLDSRSQPVYRKGTDG